MNFESLEQMRYENTKVVMSAMADIAKDPKADIEKRLEAAKIVDAMSDSIIKAYVLIEATRSTEGVVNKLSNQLKKLDDEF